MDIAPECLRAARVALNMSQKEISEVLDCDRRMIMRLESGSYVRMPFEALGLVKYYENEGITFILESSSHGPGIAWNAPLISNPFQSEQIRTGRAFADLSQIDLAENAGLGIGVIKRLESGKGELITVSAIRSVVDALKRAGVEILKDDKAGRLSVVKTKQKRPKKRRSRT